MKATSRQRLAEFANHPRLPPPPGLALQFMEEASRPDSSLRRLTDLILQDPALCAGLLRTVNSALHGLPCKVTSVERALALLGVKGARALVLGLSVTGVYQKLDLGHRLADFWKTSVAGAVIARDLAARRKNADPEEALVAGLLRDLGILILAQACPGAYERVLAAPAVVLALQRCELETELLGVNHAEVGSFVLEKWRLPPSMTEAIRYHHNPSAAPTPDLRAQAFELFFASQVALLQIIPRQLGLRRELLSLARDRLGLEAAEFRKLLEQVHLRVKACGNVLKLDLHDQKSYADLLVGATEELGFFVLEANADCLRLHLQKQQTESENARLRRQTERLRRESMRDGLTGIYNRAFLEDALATELKRAQRRGGSLGFMFIDLDDFKRFNDQYGHAFGDKVLVAAADVFRGQLRGGDVVARYGGDEFCIILSPASQEGLQALGNRLMHELNATTIRKGKHEETISASIGAVLCTSQAARRHQAHVLAAADEAMYLAKTRGKNQVVVVTLLADEDQELAEGVEKWLYSRFLLARQLVSRPEVQKLREAPVQQRTFVGRLARNLGWINPQQLRAVLAEQRQTKKMFGDVAIAQGFLHREQLFILLALQREPPENWSARLVETGLLTKTQAREETKTFYEMIRQAGDKQVRIFRAS